MELIKRKIYLEQYKNRFAKDGDESGITISDDVVIDSGQTQLLSIENNLPILTVGIKEVSEDGIVRFRGNEERYYEHIPEDVDNIVKVLRYRTMIDVLTFTESFFSRATVYRLCRRDSGKRFVVDDSEMVNIRWISSTVPTIDRTCVRIIDDEYVEDVNCGEETLPAYKISFDGSVLYNVDDSTPAKNKFEDNDRVIAGSSYEKFMKFFSIPSDSGNPTNAIERAQYFVNFANEKKRTTGGIEGFVPVSLFVEEESEDMGIFTSVVSEWVPNRKYFLGNKVIDSDGVLWTLKEGNVKINVPIPGVLYNFVNEQLENHGDIYIDAKEIDENTFYTDNEHIYVDTDNMWFVKPYYNGDFTEQFWEKETDSSTTQYTAITESRLDSFRKSDISDDTPPVQLPFRLVYDLDAEEEEGIPVLKKATEPHYGITTYVTEIPFVGVTTSRTEDKITFTYYAEGAGTDDDSKLIYTETYPYETKYDYFNVRLTEEDRDYPKYFEYIDIDFKNGELESVYDLYGNERHTLLDATINRDGTESQNVPYFKEEALFGIHDIKMSAGDLTIERGTSAAYERHSIMGEVASIEDLVKYKNGFFKVIDDENNQ